MELKNYNVYFFIILLVGISALVFLIFKPFLVAIAIATILAVAFQRPYRFFLKITRERKALSSILASLLVILTVLVPATFILALVAGEIKDLIALAENSSGGENFFVHYLKPFLDRLEDSSLSRMFESQATAGQKEFLDFTKNLGSFFLSATQAVYHSVTSFIFLAFIVFFTLFFFFIEGENFLKKMRYLIPLRDNHEKMLFEKFSSIVRATLKGALVIGLIQGAIGGIVFFIAGIESPLIWSVIMAVFSLVPMVGASLIWFPAGAIMLFLGNFWQGIFILAAGFGIISTIDNFLRPKLVGRDTQMHPLLVFFSTLGGISLFGFMGFVIGPVIMALFLTLWEIYSLEFKNQLKEYNQ